MSDSGPPPPGYYHPGPHHAHPTGAGPVPSAPAPSQYGVSHAAPQPAMYAQTSQPTNQYSAYSGYGSAAPQQNSGYGGYPTQGQQTAGYGGYAQQQQEPYNPNNYAVPFMPGPPDQAQARGDAQVFMPQLSPLNLIAGSTLFSGGQTWGQQYVQKVQQRMSLLSGGPLSFHFNVTNSYVLRKLYMLMTPFLSTWTYNRQPDQGNQHSHFQPPRSDVNSPDLYLPVMALWTYITTVCFCSLLQHKYKPDLLYSTVWSGSMSWCFHTFVLYVILRAMSLSSSVPWIELFAYTGYAYVPACIIIMAGVIGGKWSYYGAWLYTSFCMSVFLVRTLKRAVFQEARNFGQDMSTVNYMLLALAAFQFPFLFWMTNVSLPQLSFLASATAMASSPGSGAS